MNRELLTLYGLKFNPFATDLPVESLMPTPAVESFCRRVEHHLVRQGGFALITGEPGTGKSVALRLLAKRTERTEGLRVASADPSLLAPRRLLPRDGRAVRHLAGAQQSLERLQDAA